MSLTSSVRHTSWRATRLAKETFAFPHPQRAIVRWAAFAAARSFTDTLSTTVDGISYFVSTRDQAVGRVVFMGRVPDDDLLADYLDLLGNELGRPALKGATCVEVGANIGTTTLPLVLRHGVKLCISLEPAPANLTLLRANLAANGVGPDQVRVLPVAASDRPGTVEFELSSGNSGDNRVRGCQRTAGNEPELYGEKHRPVITVPAARVDDILAEQNVELSDVGLAWIDTQGHEGHVLAGAPRLLASAVPIIMEYWPYGLRRAAGLELLHQLIADSGRRIIDLQEPLRGGTPRVLSRTEWDALPERYPSNLHTDIALLAARAR
jgi:FkbM family methyltransferase